MGSLVYWLVVVVLGGLVVAALLFTANGGGVLGFGLTLVAVAVFLSYALSMRTRRHTPIAR